MSVTCEAVQVCLLIEWRCRTHFSAREWLVSNLARGVCVGGVVSCGLLCAVLTDTVCQGYLVRFREPRGSFAFSLQRMQCVGGLEGRGGRIFTPSCRDCSSLWRRADGSGCVQKVTWS